MACLGSHRHSKVRQASGAGASKARLVIHGGSGQFERDEYPPDKLALYRQGMKEALVAGNDVLKSGGHALDAVVAAMVTLENNPLFNAGKGAVFNVAGKHELEASIAVSKPPAGSGIPANRKGAAVTLLKTVKHPILLAKELYMDPEKCPHAFVSGEDAERIAREARLEIVDEHYFDTEQRWDEHKRGLKLMNPFEDLNDEEKFASQAFLKAELAKFPQGTVGAVAVDGNGMLACATSTGGKTNKNSFYSTAWKDRASAPANPFSRLLKRLTKAKGSSGTGEAGVAISGTGDGDYFIRNCAAYDVVARMKYRGDDVRSASKQVIELLKEQEGIGGLIAVDLQGNFAMPLNSTGMFRGTITPDENIARIAVWSDEKLSVEE